ncbi:MAG: hypothetical protein GY754_14770 [bacterium]|nr:hypothetical protein [bacterium]
MDIIVFSDNKKIGTCFTTVEKSKDYRVSYYPAADLKKIFKKQEEDSLIYIDLGAYEESERDKLLKYLAKQNVVHYGLIDPKGAVKRIAEQFHNGASDYISKEEFKEGINAKRIKQVLDFKIPEETQIQEELNETATERNYILTGNDWTGIEAGREYTFCFMYIDLDNQRELVKKFGDTHIKRIIKNFQTHINKLISPINGKIWMWDEMGGLILFPFNGKNCEAILTCFRLMLDRAIMCVEGFSFNMLISYRIVLHIGNTLYETRGHTGKIISETVNSIFHLGQQFAKPGLLYLTPEIYEYLPKEMEDYFTAAGEFEDREIFRMKKLL